MTKKNVCKLGRKKNFFFLFNLFYFVLFFDFSKQITESRCLQRCLDVSLDVARQINDLWEPLRRLAPLFNITAKPDFLVTMQYMKLS